MSRAVGYPASIVAQMVLSGEVRRPGIASPIRDIPPERSSTLGRRGMKVVEKEIDPRDCHVPGVRARV